MDDLDYRSTRKPGDIVIARFREPLGVCYQRHEVAANNGVYLQFDHMDSIRIDTGLCDDPDESSPCIVEPSAEIEAQMDLWEEMEARFGSLADDSGVWRYLPLRVLQELQDVMDRARRDGLIAEEAWPIEYA
jgi:hypothetical protein